MRATNPETYPSCSPLRTGLQLADNKNPYYITKSQPLLDRNGWYPVGLDFPYLSPNVLSVVANYRHDDSRSRRR